MVLYKAGNMMKSSKMIQELELANTNGNNIAISELLFYIKTGTFSVRKAIFHSLTHHRNGTSKLNKEDMFKFMIDYIDESFAIIPNHEFIYDCQILLNEIEGYKLDPDVKRHIIQMFISMLDTLIQNKDNRELLEVTVIENITRVFPEVLDKKLYNCSVDMFESMRRSRDYG